MTTNTRSQTGFTLIEMLVASVLMIVGVYSILAVLPQAARTSNKAGHLSTLNHLASEQIEHLRSLNYADATLTAGTHPTLQFGTYPVPGFPGEFSMRWIVSAGPTDGSGTVESRMKTVSVEATYFVRYDLSGNPIENPDGLKVTFRTFLSE